MRVTMLQTIEGSPDGLRVLVYRKGETYDVPDELGKVFFRERWAASVPLDPMPPRRKRGADLSAAIRRPPCKACPREGGEPGRGDLQGKDAGAAPENKTVQKVKTVSLGKKKQP